MSIEVKKPTKEFYDSLDTCVNHAIKSRDAFKMAVEIGRKQGFNDFKIKYFINEYLKDKIPKTSRYRYLRELVPLELVDHKDPPGYEIRKALEEIIEKIEETKDILRDLMDRGDEIWARLKPKERKARVEFLRQWSKHQRTLNIILHSFTDERYSYSLWKWFQIVIDIKEQGYGYAADKYKIEIIDQDGNKTGKYWKFTRKEIKKMMPTLEKQMIAFKNAATFFQNACEFIEPKKYENGKIIQALFAGFSGLSDWRDVHSDLNGRIADRRRRLSPILSEQAIG